jgi:hypothetical protein
MEEKFYTCPYCKQYVSTLLDTGVEGIIELVDDCEVCCRPIEFEYIVNDYCIERFRIFPIDGNEF